VKVALLTEIPAPYRMPLFNALAALDGVELEVIFLRARDPKRPDYRFDPADARFSWRILPGRHVARRGRWMIVNRGVARTLLRIRPDAIVVGGWAQPAFWQALLAAKLLRRPTLTWIESTSRDERSGAASLERAKRRFVRSSDGALVPGRASVEYVQSLGAAPERIAVAPNAVDFTRFGERVDAVRQDRDALRARLGIVGVCLLCVGRLDPEKSIDTLIRALGELPPEATLVVAGSGSVEHELHALAEQLVPGRVRFLGFVQPDELVDWYAAADVFVLPSRSEQWGMTLNEAGAAGLPLVATDAAGGAHDLIEDAVSGFRVAAGDEQALAAALTRLATDEPFRDAAGLRSRELAEQLTAERWADAVSALARKLSS
jgi:glycosyltransferase involved in cell wall biosynthesis